VREERGYFPSLSRRSGNFIRSDIDAPSRPWCTGECASCRSRPCRRWCLCLESVGLSPRLSVCRNPGTLD